MANPHKSLQAWSHQKQLKKIHFKKIYIKSGTIFRMWYLPNFIITLYLNFYKIEKNREVSCARCKLNESKTGSESANFRSPGFKERNEPSRGRTDTVMPCISMQNSGKTRAAKKFYPYFASCTYSKISIFGFCQFVRSVRKKTSWINMTYWCRYTFYLYYGKNLLTLNTIFLNENLIRNLTSKSMNME